MAKGRAFRRATRATLLLQDAWNCRFMASKACPSKSSSLSASSCTDRHRLPSGGRFPQGECGYSHIWLEAKQQLVRGVACGGVHPVYIRLPCCRQHEFPMLHMIIHKLGQDPLDGLDK